VTIWTGWLIWGAVAVVSFILGRVYERAVMDMQRGYGNAVYHGPACDAGGCRSRPGDLLTETAHGNRSSADIEWQVSKHRVDNPTDHAGTCTRWGPDIPADTYPEVRS
jgi:hypothetical protein